MKKPDFMASMTTGRRSTRYSLAIETLAPVRSRRLPKAITAVKVLRQFRELFRLSQQNFQRIGASCGVSGAQLWALAELDARPGLRVSDLANALSVHLSTASNLLDRLQAESLVRRERSERDQRIVRVRLTKAGQRILHAAPRPASGVIPDALDRVPVEALVGLSRELTFIARPDAGPRSPRGHEAAASH